MFLNDHLLLDNCKNSSSLARTPMTTWLEFFMNEKDIWHQSCPIPCTQTTYHLTTATFHGNSVIDRAWVESFGEEALAFYMNFDSFKIERHVETLRYDLVDFLTQAGGNLGLFLGCSCFSIIISGIELFRSLKF